jgi:hypothetical protein
MSFGYRRLEVWSKNIAAFVLKFCRVLINLLQSICFQTKEHFSVSYDGYRANSVVYPTGHATEDCTNETNKKAARLKQRYSACGSRKCKNKGQKHKKPSRVRDVRIFSITDRAVDSTQNADSVVESDTVPRLREKTVQRVWIRRTFPRWGRVRFKRVPR